jgi:anti-anti-sigma factor
MFFNSTIKGAEATVFLEGKISFQNSNDLNTVLKPLLEDATLKEIHLDLAAVTYIDSGGIGLFLHAKRKAETSGKDLVLRRPTPTVDGILKVVNFAKLMRIEA